MKIQYSAATLAALLCSSLANAADAPAECHFTRVAEVPLAYTGPGLQVTMEGRINGAPAIVLVDTGAWDSALTRTATDRLGLTLNMTRTHARGVGGNSRIYYAQLKDFAFGPAKGINGRFPVIGDTGFAPSFDAIAGATFLLQADMEINLAEKKLKFFRPTGCNDRFLAYWDENASAIPFGFQDDRHINPHFFIEVNGHKLDAIIDTGASTTGIHSYAAKRIGLKLDDAARIGNVVGIGDHVSAQWAAHIDSMVIGDETIKDTDVSVFESEGGSNEPDVLLGDDWLRAHRVLFAMSQQKMYISYVGGDPFWTKKQLEPWVMREAEAGNSDAQLILSKAYFAGQKVPRDSAMAEAWLQKAAAQGNPRADLMLGERLLSQRYYAQAAIKLHDALERLPGERFGALKLYVARLQSGQADLAKSELEASAAREDHDQWPAPLADFYLGRIDEAAVLKLAGSEAHQAKTRTCDAAAYMSQLYEARAEHDKAGRVRAQCAAATSVVVAK